MIETVDIVVSAASGNVGREAVRAVRRLGLPVRAGGPDVGELRPLIDEEVPLVRLDFRDPSTFRLALAGATSIFLSGPPPISDVKAALLPFVAAAREGSVRHIVFLSAAGLGDTRLLPHTLVEQFLRATFADYTFLRPGLFTQHLGGTYRDDIVREGRLVVPAARGRVAFVDVRDVAEVAAKVLADPSSHRGRVYTLTGPEAISFAEVAELLSEVLGRPIRYEPATLVAYVRRLHDRGVPLTKIAVETMLHVGLRYGQADRVDPTLERLLGRRGHTVERYVRDHHKLWTAQAMSG